MMLRLSILGLSLALLPIGFGPTVQGADPDPLRQKQQAQAQARALAEELVSTVLDIQLRQLDENGLQSLPLYRDIAAMKSNIRGLVDRDMDAIVQLLVEAQEAAPSQRDAKLNAARAKIREVAVQLMAERQRLYRRMHIAKLSADVRQLVVLQSKALDATRSLKERRPDQRDRLALDTINDQADVTKLFYQLVASLGDVSTWGGTAAAGAADGLRILRAAQVEPELKQASQFLASADFQLAAVSQQNILKGFSALLEKLEETQGLIDSDREAALRLVRELIDRQRDLCERTGHVELTERTAEPLIQQQTRLQKELGKLPPALAKFPLAESLIEHAKAASFEATASLFEEKQAAALDQQNRVIGDLAQIETILEQSLDLAHANKSAADLTAEIAQLEALARQLDKADREQFAAISTAIDRPQAAEQHEKQTAGVLTAADKIGDFPSTITARLNDAKEMVASAEHVMQQRAAANADSRQVAAEQALAAIRAAEAEVQSQLADTRRWQKAVEVGELARAAEALERAASAETEIAHQTADAAQANGLSAEQATKLGIEQTNVAAVAERISTGVAESAPTATRTLKDAAPALDKAARALKTAEGQPDESSKATVANASAAAKSAAQQLTSAAAELRREQGRAAQELEKIANQQLAAADSARDAVQKAAEATNSISVDALAALEQTQKKSDEAITEQLRATGRGVAADAKSLTRQIGDLSREQQAADDAAQALARGQANNPLTAATQQEQVADRATQVAAQAPPEVAQPLNEASKSAAVAARETFSGSPAKAQQARNQARAAIAQALRSAEQLAKQATQSQPTAPDPAAQAKAAEKAAEAEQLAAGAEKSAGDVARPAAETLHRAALQAATARRQLETGEVSQATASQRQTQESLDDSVRKLDLAIRQLAVRQSQQLENLAQEASTLSDLARRVDPDAAAALSQAKSAANRGRNLADRPNQLANAEREARQKIDQATASLAARAQQLRRDRDLALALAQLATDQQTARDAIAQASRRLELPSTSNSDASSQLAAAQALQQAQQLFAAAQTTTGEGATEVSGQQEVANRPIREGLEIASRLNQQALPKESGDAEQAANENEPSPAEKNTDSTSTPQQSQPPNPKSPPSDLGTKMVPNSPQITAKQLAGQKANNAAATAMANALKGKGQPGKNEGESETPMEGAASPTAKKGGAAKGGKSANNQKTAKGDLETADAADADSRGERANQDASAAGRGLENEAWFAKLPPSLRSAIQAKSRGKAPRGYEERLRRYFESID